MVNSVVMIFLINITNIAITIISIVIIVVVTGGFSVFGVVQGAYSHSLAEWALTACSWFAKDLPRLKRQQKDRNWEPYYVEELR